jgi:hypothetical protein
MLDTSQKVVWVLWALFGREVRHRAWIWSVISVRISLSKTRLVYSYKHDAVDLHFPSSRYYFIAGFRSMNKTYKTTRYWTLVFHIRCFILKKISKCFKKNDASHFVCNIIMNWNCSWEAHIVAQLVKIFPNSCRTSRWIMVSTRAHRWINFPLLR